MSGGDPRWVGWTVKIIANLSLFFPSQKTPIYVFGPSNLGYSLLSNALLSEKLSLEVAFSLGTVFEDHFSSSIFTLSFFLAFRRLSTSLDSDSYNILKTFPQWAFRQASIKREEWQCRMGMGDGSLSSMDGLRHIPRLDLDMVYRQRNHESDNLWRSGALVL